MSYGFKFSTRTKLLAGALALVLAGVSHAAAGIQVGGGATLPSVGYVGSNAANTSGVLQFFGTGATNGIASGSLFGQYSANSPDPGVSYCLTGSGAGKDVLAGGTIGANTYSVQNACAKNANGVVNGFGADATGVGRSDLTQPNFAGADSPINASDLSNYQATGAHGSSAWPTQFPVIAGAIGVAFNLKDSTGAQITASEVNFSDAQVCEIFSGEVTNWDSSDLTSAFTLPAGHSAPNATIAVQFRSDGSGTSFSFSNHLAWVCGTINSTTFETSQNFAGAGGIVSNFFPVSGGTQTLPSSWTGSSGNNGVATAVKNTANSIGYVEVANAIASGIGLQLADVNGTSPTANFGTALTLQPADYKTNNVISTTNNSNGQAVLSAISNPPSTSCIVLVNPENYATPTKGGLVPTGTYPIVAISYFLGNAQNNETSDLAATQALVDAPYNSTITSKVTTVGKGTGLAFLTLSSTAFSATAPGDCLTTAAP